MTVQAYIQSKLERFDFGVDSSEIEVLLGAQGVNPSAELSPTNMASVKHVIHGLIPEMLLAPDISQGRFSIKHNIEGIKAYYRLLCEELGLENKLDSQPKVTDRSNYW